MNFTYKITFVLTKSLPIKIHDSRLTPVGRASLEDHLHPQDNLLSGWEELSEKYSLKMEWKENYMEWSLDSTFSGWMDDQIPLEIPLLDSEGSSDKPPYSKIKLYRVLSFISMVVEAEAEARAPPPPFFNPLPKGWKNEREVRTLESLTLHGWVPLLGAHGC